MAKKLVRDIMTKEVVSILEGATIRDALRRMGEKGVSSLVVLRGGDRPYGIVTRGDTIRAVVEGGVSLDARVEEIMTAPLILATPNLRIRDAARLMQRHGVRRLPVLQKGEIVGIISTSDVFSYLVRRAGYRAALA